MLSKVANSFHAHIVNKVKPLTFEKQSLKLSIPAIRRFEFVCQTRQKLMNYANF